MKLRQRMQVNNNQESGCSSRSRSSILQWSGTELNPDRPFYGCPNYNTSGQRWCDLFVWADGEEDEGMAGKTQCETKVDQVKINLGCRVSKPEDDIRVLKCWILGLSRVMMMVLFGIVRNDLELGK
ncbi:hypothetical protein PIB30_085958 [Stylosanthes scabra]|uniref:Zinc finger GRF-type domain-containing protein n=1 Tax=Stylosanthes scabra TaxID=79078 RepID=A0ABU6SUH1_9FABA|nr:hypothetical protein [Stylosanthes scabra]